MDDLDELTGSCPGAGMATKITGKVSKATRRKLEGLAATKFRGGIGRATVHVLKKGLSNPDAVNSMVEGNDVVCSVMVEDDVVAQITRFQGDNGIAKRTEAAKSLIEIGLSIIDLEISSSKPEI